VLDNFAPDIQEQVLALPRTVRGRDAILEREVRPIAKTHDWAEQRKMWTKIVQRLQGPLPTEQNKSKNQITSPHWRHADAADQ